MSETNILALFQYMEERERRNAVAQNRSITIGAENEVRKVVVGDRLNVCICFIEIEFVPTRC